MSPLKGMSDSQARVRIPPEDRFWPKVEAADGCWLWTGGRLPLGYGVFWTPDRGSIYAHRWAYEYVVGVIPPGLEIDHLCRNPPCVNPVHLEAVTHAENVRRGHAGDEFRRKTHCGKGHLYTEENTRMDKKRARRVCRTCMREYDRARKARDRCR